MEDVDIVEEVAKRTCTVVVRDVMQGKEFVDSKKFNCNICKQKFKLKLDLKKHRLLHDKQNLPFVCDICGKAYSRNCVLYIHKLRHSDKKRFECPVCKKLFEVKGEMTFHQKIHNKNRTADFRCKVCGKYYMHKSGLNSHELLHSNPKSFKCGICDKNFLQKKSWEEHELTHSVTEKLFSCQTCDKRFLTYVKMRKHSVIHKKKQFACKQCPKTFTYLIHLERHEIWHKNGDEKNAPYVCKTCNKTFLCNQSHNRHIQICCKNEKKSFVCDKCGKNFQWKCLLKNHHQRTHNATCTEIKKSFVCDKCGKSFQWKCLLKNHNQRIHNATCTEIKKPFVCDKCGKSFQWKCLLKKHHQRTHSAHSAPRLPCDICGRTFLLKEYLRRHTLRVHNENAHHELSTPKDKKKRLTHSVSATHTRIPCDKCDQTFLLKEYLRRHTLRVHSENALQKSNKKDDITMDQLEILTNRKWVYFDHSYFKRNSGALELSSMRRILSENLVTSSTAPVSTSFDSADSVSTISNIVIPKSTVSDCSIQSDRTITKSMACDKTSKSTTSKTTSDFFQLNSVTTNSNASDFSTSHTDLTAISTVDSIQSNGVFTVKLNQPKRVMSVLYRCSLCSNLFDDKKTLQKHVEEHSTVVQKVATPATTYRCVECCMELIIITNSMIEFRIPMGV